MTLSTLCLETNAKWQSLLLFIPRSWPSKLGTYTWPAKLVSASSLQQWIGWPERPFPTGMKPIRPFNVKKICSLPKSNKCFCAILVLLTQHIVNEVKKNIRKKRYLILCMRILAFAFRPRHCQLVYDLQPSHCTAHTMTWSDRMLQLLCCYCNLQHMWRFQVGGTLTLIRTMDDNEKIVVCTKKNVYLN